MNKLFKSVISVGSSIAMLLTAAAVPAYAKDTISVASTVKVVKSQLDFASKSKSAKGTGWEWNEETKTLTLENFNQKTTEESIILPDDQVTVKLIGKNNITVNSDGTRGDRLVAYCIFTEGNVNFTGSGSLNCNCTNSNGGSGAIAADNVIINIGGKLTVNSSCDDGFSRGIFSRETTVIDRGIVKITCANKCKNLDSKSIGITADSLFELGRNASVEINYDGLGNFCGVCTANGKRSFGKYVNYGTLKANIKSTDGYGYAIAASHVTEAGKADIKIQSALSAVAIYSYSSVGIISADFKADLSSDTKVDEGAVTGIYCNKYINICDSNISINSVSTNGAEAEGILSFREIYAKNSNLDINASSSSDKACGIYLWLFEERADETIGVTLDNCTGTIKGSVGAALMSAKSLTLKGCTVENCDISSCDYNGVKYYSFSESGKTMEVINDTFDNITEEIVLTK